MLKYHWFRKGNSTSAIKNVETPESDTISIHNLINKVILYAPGTIIPAIISFMSIIIFTRIFGAKEYGQYSLVIGIATLIIAILSQWVQQSINRYLSVAKQDAQKALIKDTLAIILVGITLIIIIVSIVSLPILLWLLPKEWLPFILPCVIFILGGSLFGPLIVILQAEMRASEYTWFTLSNAILKFLIALGIVLFLTREAAGLLWGVALAYLILIPFLWFNGRLPNVAGITFGRIKELKIEIKKFMIYGFPMMGWFIACILLDVGDRYIIQWFQGAQAVGIYSANYSLIAGGMGLITAPILLGAHPFLMKAWEEKDDTEISRWLAIIVEILFVSGIFLVAVTWLLSNDFARWFLGPEFREGHIIMPIVMLGIVFWQLGMYIHKPLEFAEKTDLMMILSFIAAGMNIFLNIILVPRYGFVSAAYATLVSYVLYNIMVFHYGRQILMWKIHWARLVSNFLIIATTAVVINVGRQYLEQYYGYLMGLGTCIFCVFLLAFVVIRKNGIGKMVH